MSTLNTSNTPNTPNTPTVIPLVPPQQQPQATTRRKRYGLLGLAAATALLLLGGGIAAGIMAGDGDSGTTPEAAALTLTADGTPAKCAEPTPDTLRGYPTLFEGTVTSIEGTVVTFRVDHWLTGGDGADTVLLDSAPDRPETLTFTAGEPYLVAADNGVVPPCGANWISPETSAEFRRAFGA